MLPVMVVLKEPRLKVRVKGPQREVRSSWVSRCSRKTGELGEKALFDGAKEPLNFSPAPWLARPRKDQLHFQISGDLFQMATGKI
jgi:hypothetical protein